MKARLFLLMFLSSIQLVAQKEAISSKELSKANGTISVESIYPVDTTMLSESLVWLDSTFDQVKHPSINRIYCIRQIQAFDFWKIGKLRNRQPISFKIDSLCSMVSNYSIEKPKFQLIKGTIAYKLTNGGIALYKIENGKVESIEFWTKNYKRLFGVVNYSGLYKVDDKTWPITIGYDKKGEINSVCTEYYLNHHVCFVDWKY